MTLPAFAWTEKGAAIHITDDSRHTRCGWPITGAPVSADDVCWYGVCKKCRGSL